MDGKKIKQLQTQIKSFIELTMLDNFLANTFCTIHYLTKPAPEIKGTLRLIYLMDLTSWTSEAHQGKFSIDMNITLISPSVQAHQIRL